MLEKSQILEELSQMLDEHHLFDQPVTALLKKDLIDDCMIDSMTMMQLQALVEDRFRIAVPSTLVIKELRTLDDLVNYIAAHQS
jgi:acyl carrier protein